MISQFICRPRSGDERIALSSSVLADSYTPVYQSTGLVSQFILWADWIVRRLLRSNSILLDGNISTEPLTELVLEPAE